MKSTQEVPRLSDHQLFKASTRPMYTDGGKCLVCGRVFPVVKGKGSRASLVSHGRKHVREGKALEGTSGTFHRPTFRLPPTEEERQVVERQVMEQKARHAESLRFSELRWTVEQAELDIIKAVRAGLPLDSHIAALHAADAALAAVSS